MNSPWSKSPKFGGNASITGGVIAVDDGTAAAPPISFASAPTLGFYRFNATTIGVTAGNNASILLGSATLSLDGDVAVQWNASTAFGGSFDTRISRQAAGVVAVNSATATPAGGGGVALVFGSTTGFGIYIGSGVPTVSAAQGSLYLRSDGSSTSTRAYINSSAGSGTTWTAITTAT